MEFTLQEAKSRLAELIVASQSGERVVIIKHGIPAVEIVPLRTAGAIDFDKLSVTCARLGIEQGQEKWPAEFDNPSFSRRVLGID